MKIELLHSITHDGVEYSPGIHDLPDALAELFLGITHENPGAAALYHPARKFVPAAEEKPAGQTKAAADVATVQADHAATVGETPLKKKKG